MSVYFIKVGRYFKIGASDDPERRCARLSQGSSRYTFPADVGFKDERTLYKVIPGWKTEEQSIHLALDQFSVGLECKNVHHATTDDLGDHGRHSDESDH